MPLILNNVSVIQCVIQFNSVILCFSDSGKYGFTDRVFDGMTVTINSVIVKFKSKVFNASLEVLFALKLRSHSINEIIIK